VEDRELILHQVRSFRDRRECQTELAMLDLVPPSAHTDLDPAAAHLVHGRDDLGKRARVAERDRRDQHTETDPVRVTRQAGHDGPGVGRRLPGRARETLEMVRAKEGLDPIRLGALRDRNVVGVAQSLL
jgi:hypothetical protein